MGETTFPTGELITGFQPINSSEHPAGSCQPDQETMYLAAFCRENQAGCVNFPSTNLTRDFFQFLPTNPSICKDHRAMGSSQVAATIFSEVACNTLITSCGRTSLWHTAQHVAEEVAFTMQPASWKHPALVASNWLIGKCVFQHS